MGCFVEDLRLSSTGRSFGTASSAAAFAGRRALGGSLGDAGSDLGDEGGGFVGEKDGLGDVGGDFGREVWEGVLGDLEDDFASISRGTSGVDDFSGHCPSGACSSNRLETAIIVSFSWP